MTGATDSNGRALPALETPDADKLRVYGDMLFLAFRSPRHARMTTALLRTYLEPAIELGQFRVFRFDGVPRAMFTWAWLNSEAEEKLVTGVPLDREDWVSGDHLWIIDMIAPYRGLMTSIGRWIMQRGNVTDREFRFRRVSGQNQTQRIVHVDFDRERLSRTMTEEEFLRGL